ncbi:MAG TPA: sigma 54-interacting transcriptional regulator [Kofleriaceae bacterium]|jgi:transcriptional regulator with GAF, ATPase, and Fis domain|nr:sigma 54-interacting transcriptional regulator [Kofleriaceae bacterium]
MSLARLVVVEGPDTGREFELPLRGGAVGRGDGSLVLLTDPTVSRQHGLIELRDGALCWVDSGRARTLINGAPVTVRALEAGDEIVLGSTRLVYLPVDGVAVTQASSHVTMEVGSRQLMALSAGDAGDHRARRQLAALAQLGDRLRAEASAGREAAARAACDAALTALGAHRAFVVSAPQPGQAGRRVAPVAAAVAPGETTQLQAPAELVDKVVGARQVVTAETGGRALIAAPVHGVADDVIGILWIDRRGAPWDSTDTLAAGCLAHLAGAAWVGADARDQLTRRADALDEQLNGPPTDADFVGRSAAAQRVIAFVHRVAPSDATVLLGGESGSGKEMVARAIHRASRRARGPCVAVNCAALTDSLIESELFGHEKGAFTGATEKKAGRFEMADRGTLFLDEVGELPLGLQTKFLRVLEERRFERVGGQRALEVDVRVVAATNRDLAEMVRRGTFREDLYYRLSVIHIDVPPLRDRLDDVPLLAEFFLARFRSQAARRISGFAPDAIAAMTRYAWPGNVRELRNAVERAVVLGDREQITAPDLPPQVLAAAAPPRARPSPPTPPLGSHSVGLHAVTIDPLPPPPPAATPPPTAPRPPPARSLRELEKQGILAALAATGGNKAQAAAILEIDRSTLYKKLKDYDIEG